MPRQSRIDARPPHSPARHLSAMSSRKTGLLRRGRRGGIAGRRRVRFIIRNAQSFDRLRSVLQFSASTAWTFLLRRVFDFFKGGLNNLALRDWLVTAKRFFSQKVSGCFISSCSAASAYVFEFTSSAFALQIIGIAQQFEDF